MRTYFLLIALFLFSHLQSYSQEKDMAALEDSLSHYGKNMFASISEPIRLENNFAFINTLVEALKNKNSFDYPFSRLEMISILTDPDSTFRVFSWNIPLNDGSYLFYGSIQFRTPSGELKLLPLLDKTFEIENPQTEILSSDKWYGAQYYDIIPIKDSYILLGWKGHSKDYTQKVIEILTIDEDSVQLGKAVFLENEKWTRRVFNYTRQASMYLRYHPEEKQIYFDHIAPLKEELKGEYKYYGPDLSHDAYEIKNDKLEFKEDVELRNEN